MDAIEEAFNQADSYDVILALADVVRQTAVAHQLSFTDLKQGQRIALLLEMFGVEMGDGGFHKLLTEPAGDYLPQILQTCEIIGAVQTAPILARATALFPKMHILINTEARQNWIESAGPDMKATLQALDTDYFAQAEQIFALGVAFLQNSKDDFRVAYRKQTEPEGEEGE